MEPTNSYISLSSLAGAVGRLLSLAYYLIIGVFFVQFALLVLSEFSSLIRDGIESNTTYFILGSVPGILALLLAVYLYEGLSYSARLSNAFRYISIIALLVIIAPSIALLAKGSIAPHHPVATILLALLTGVAFFVRAPSYDDESNARLLRAVEQHLRFMLRDLWFQPLPSISEKHVDNRELRIERAPRYRDAAALLLFQQSLSCPELDSLGAAQLLSDWKTARRIRMLDIGGADGSFTHSLLSRLSQDNRIAIDEVLMVDPVNWRKAYADALSPHVDTKRIVIRDECFEDAHIDREYDLVIASHSLYAVCDALGNDSAKIQTAVVQRLLSLVAPKGRLVIVVASTRGQAYQFKDKALKSFGHLERDASAESLFESLMIGRFDVEHAYIDNVFDLTVPIKEWKSGNLGALESWLSYFLRLDMRDLRAESRALLADLLGHFTLRVDQLPESQIKQLTGLKCLQLTRDSIVLPHKTRVMVLKHKSHNSLGA